MVDCSRLFIEENTNPEESRLGTYAAWKGATDRAVIYGNEWSQLYKTNIGFVICIINHEFLHGIIEEVFGGIVSWEDPHWPYYYEIDLICGYDYISIAPKNIGGFDQANKIINYEKEFEEELPQIISRIRALSGRGLLLTGRRDCLAQLI